MDKRQAIEAFGTQGNLARVLHVSSEAVRQWPETVPEPRASQIREAIRAKIVRLQELVG